MLPGPSVTRSECDPDDIVKRISGDGRRDLLRVNWHYVAKDGRWVMLRDTEGGVRSWRLAGCSCPVRPSPRTSTWPA